MIEKTKFTTTNLIIGEAQVHAEGYLDDRSIYKSLQYYRTHSDAKDLGFKPSRFYPYILGPKGWVSETYIIQVEALQSILNQRITYLK